MQFRFHTLWPDSRIARLIFAVAFVLLIATALIVLFKREPQNLKVSRGEPEKRRDSAGLNRDSDGDGLKDWEEAIYRTDPANPDTDGDGTADGDEIRAGRDPSKRGPDDLLATSTPFAEAELAPSSPENLTERLALKFNERFVVPFLANPGQFPSPELWGTAVVEEALSPSGAVSDALQLTERELVLTNDSSPEAIRAYAKSAETIVTTAFERLFEKQDIQIFAEVVQTENFARLSELDSYLAAYETAISKLKQLETPTALAPLHLEYIRAVTRQWDAVRKMRHAETDIVAAIVAAREYVVAFERGKEVVGKFQDEFLKRGVTAF